MAKVDHWVWYAFLAVFAWQTRIIIWQADPLFWEWRSISFWLSDACMLALFALAVWRGWRPRLQGADWLLAFVFSAAVLSLGNADHVGIGLYQLARLAQYILLYLYLRQWASVKFDAATSAVVFVAGALFQAALGIGQYIFQHDIGLRWAGETLLRTDLRGVAVFYDLAQEKVLRAYGTLPHPNVLAVVLMSATWVLAWLWLRGGAERRAHLAVWTTVAITLLWGMYLTFSRTMLAAWVGASAVVVVCAYWPQVSAHWANIAVVRRRLSMAIALTVVVSGMFLILMWPKVYARMTVHVGDEAVALRVRYAQDALTSGGAGLNVNWTGVGIGNFTSWLMRYDTSLPRFMYQPVHNIYLLAYTEIGLIGAVLWLAWLATVARRAWNAHAGQPLVRVGVIALLGAFMCIGLSDHFFWSLQQGRILFWLALAVAAGPQRS
jgi:hypothetical protein